MFAQNNKRSVTTPPRTIYLVFTIVTVPGRSSDVELGASGAKALLIFNYLMPTCWLLLPLKTPQQLTKMFQPQQRAQQVPAGPKRQKLQKYANMFRNNMK